MIQELKIKNFLSFKNEVVFSFEATKDSTLDSYYVKEVAPGVRLLKLAMLYGANASGKSNLINVIYFLNDFVFRLAENKEEEIDFIPFAFDESKFKPGILDLTFYIDERKYIYHLELDKQKVIKETLYYYPSIQPAIVFDRYYDSKTQTSVINFGQKLKISKLVKEEIAIKTLKNISVFAAKSQMNVVIKEMDEVYNWFKKQFLRPIGPNIRLVEFANEMISKELEAKKFLLNFLNKADFNIEDIVFERETKEIKGDLLEAIESAPISKKQKEELILKGSIDLENLSFMHRIKSSDKTKYFALKEDLQSKGTLRYYGLSAAIYRVLKDNAFISIDEIESSLHPLLVNHFLREFLEQSDSAQILFTTHNMSLLNEKELLRKDSIWFTEKGEDGSTQLFSVADYPDFRKELSFYNYYKHGKFGAVPNID